MMAVYVHKHCIVHELRSEAVRGSSDDLVEAILGRVCGHGVHGDGERREIRFWFESFALAGARYYSTMWICGKA